MRISAFLLILSALAPAAAASNSTPYDLAPGQSGSYVVHGETVTIHQETGSVYVDAITPLADGFKLVTLRCSDRSTERCTGTIEGS